MELHYSRPNLLNTVLRDARGTPMYRIESPRKMANRLTTITRFVPPGAPLSPPVPDVDGASSSGGGPDGSAASAPKIKRVRSDNASDTDILLAGLEEHVVAQIVWQHFEDTVFKFGGREVKLGEYLPKLKAWQRTRIFTAGNGKKYAWASRALVCWLRRNDDSREVVVRKHRRTFGIGSGDAHYAWLEINPELIPILDEIVMSFVYIERRRQQRDG